MWLLGISNSLFNRSVFFRWKRFPIFEQIAISLKSRKIAVSGHVKIKKVSAVTAKLRKLMIFVNGAGSFPSAFEDAQSPQKRQNVSGTSAFISVKNGVEFRQFVGIRPSNTDRLKHRQGAYHTFFYSGFSLFFSLFRLKKLK